MASCPADSFDLMGADFGVHPKTTQVDIKLTKCSWKTTSTSLNRKYILVTQDHPSRRKIVCMINTAALSQIMNTVFLKKKSCCRFLKMQLFNALSTTNKTLLTSTVLRQKPQRQMLHMLCYTTYFSTFCQWHIRIYSFSACFCISLKLRTRRFL